VAKYDPLTRFLNREAILEICLSFQEIERVLGAKLPPSAYRHRPWWANDPSNHVHAKAWLSAGYETAHVDMEGGKLTFRRVQGASPQPAEETGPLWPRRHPMFGAMKGWITIRPDYDLTQPAMPE
jgi:hypothetical protein